MRRSTVTWDRHLGKQDFQLYVDEPALSSRRRSVNPRDYDVFISHKGDDMNLAVNIGDTLHSNGVQGYLDKWDPAVDGDSPELEDHLRDVIRSTPSILAVVTENTPLSWWVPFEIGVARETESQIATVLSVDELSSKIVELPSYLGKWPILTEELELTTWARAITSSSEYSYGTRSTYIEKSLQDEYPRVPGIDNLTMSGKVRFVRQ